MDNQATNGESKIGPIIGIIIVVIVLIIGALYFWGQKLNNQTTEVKTETVSTTENAVVADEETDATVANLKAQSNSDDLTSISNDLNATVITSVDADLQKASQ